MNSWIQPAVPIRDETGKMPSAVFGTGFVLPIFAGWIRFWIIQQNPEPVSNSYIANLFGVLFLPGLKMSLVDMESRQISSYSLKIFFKIVGNFIRFNSKISPKIFYYYAFKTKQLSIWSTTKKEGKTTK